MNDKVFILRLGQQREGGEEEEDNKKVGKWNEFCLLFSCNKNRIDFFLCLHTACCFTLAEFKTDSLLACFYSIMYIMHCTFNWEKGGKELDTQKKKN